MLPIVEWWSSPIWFVVVEWTKEGCLSSESDTQYVHVVPNECVAPNLSISRCDQLRWSSGVNLTFQFVWNKVHSSGIKQLDIVLAKLMFSGKLLIK